MLLTKQAEIDHNLFRLFDLVYYRMYLPPKVMRTYLNQMISELERNPKMSVVERHDLLVDKSLSQMIVNQEHPQMRARIWLLNCLNPQWTQQQYQRRYDSIIPTITSAR